MSERGAWIICAEPRADSDGVSCWQAGILSLLIIFSVVSVFFVLKIELGLDKQSSHRIRHLSLKDRNVGDYKVSLRRFISLTVYSLWSGTILGSFKSGCNMSTTTISICARCCPE